MTYVLGAIALALTGAVITFVKWWRDEVKEAKALRELFDGQRELANEYKSARDTEVAAHGVTKDQLASEHEARLLAETQRNDAQERARTLLKKHMEDASDDEIRSLVDDVFSGVSAAVPQVPRADRAASNDSDLEVPM